MAGYFTITGKGFYTGNNTVIAGTLTLTSGSDTVNINFGAASAEGNFTVSSNFNTPRFLVTGNYNAAVKLTTSAATGTYSVSLPAAFPVVAATAYTQPALAVTLLSPQSGGCDATGCDLAINGTVAVTPATQGTAYVFLRSSASTSGAYYQSGQALTSAAGAVAFTGSISSFVGGLSASGASAAAFLSSGNTLAPNNVALAVSAGFTDGSSSAKFTRFPEGTSGLTASVTLTTGVTDVTAPTCSLVSFAPATINTINLPIDTTITLTCADENGGTGLWTKGVFLTATVSSGAGGSIVTDVSPFTTSTSTDFYVPPYLSGSVAITGVWAIDNAGNAVVYGSCAGVVGYDSLGCSGGGSGSSASTTVVSLFALAFVAIAALFA
jgi:hypothetical protein